MPATPNPQAPDPELVERLVVHCLDATDRDAALRAVRGEHPECADRVAASLDALRDQGFLAEQTPVPRRGMPDRLGSFRLLRELGAGGMGIVYLAEEEDLGRKVAIKLIRPEHLYFPGSRERFQREAEAVARLNHPGIVPIYSVGEDGGLPFFAMEFVEGDSLANIVQRLARKATTTALSAADLLPGAGNPAASSSTSRSRGLSADRSWADACVTIATELADALAHAHERGVLHRDVKPSNILITPHGAVRLLDFGLARTEDAQQLTQTATQIGSLPYLPPEQFDPRTAIASVRHDVYSLGVTLYETLALQNPFLGTTAEETRRNILAARPPRLRGSRTNVNWDLETVCLTAMDPDPAQRYASMAGFLEDLENVRSRRPITARRPNLWIRARRFAQRHRTLAAVAGVTGLLGATAAVVIAILANTARLEADRLTRAAEQRATEATRVTEFLVELFQQADPKFSLGERMPVGLLLDQAAERIDTELSDQPEISARLFHTLGRVYMSLAEFDRAETNFTAAAEHAAEALGEQAPATLLDRLDAAAAARGHRRLHAVDAMLSRVAASVETLPEDHPLRRRLLFEQGQQHRHRGEWKQAEQCFRRRLSWYRSNEPATIGLAVALRDFATYLREVRRDSEAAEYYAECLKILDAKLPARHPTHISTRSGLARNLANLGATKRAVEIIDAVIVDAEAVYGDGHPLVGAYLEAKAHIHNRAGEVDASIDALERALKIAESVGAYSDAYLARMLNNLSVNYLDIGRVRRARTLAERALAACKRAFPGDHPLKGLLHQNLAEALRELGDTSHAEQLAREGLAILRRVDESGRDLPAALNTLAWILAAMGPQRSTEAMQLTSEALRAATPYPTQLWELGRAHVIRGFVANMRGDGKAAERELARGIADYDEARRGDYEPKALALYNMAWARLLQKDRNGAEPWFEKSLAMYDRMNQGHASKAWPLNHYGFALMNDRPEEAVRYLEEGLAIRKRVYDESADPRLVSQVNLATAYKNLGRFADAEALFVHVYDIVAAKTGPRSAAARSCAHRLVTLYDAWGKADLAAKYRALRK